MSRRKKEQPIRPRNNMRLRMGNGERRNFSTFKWTAISPSPEITRSESFWHVRSNVSEEAMLKYLRLKFFWKELSDAETEFAMTHPRFFSDMQLEVCLAVLNTTRLLREEIMERMSKACSLLGWKNKFAKGLLRQWENNVLIIADLETRSIRPHKAFSGWVRNASSLGSKRKRPSIPEPMSEAVFEEKFDEFTFLYELISVGRIETNSGVISLS